MVGGQTVVRVGKQVGDGAEHVEQGHEKQQDQPDQTSAAPGRPIRL